MKNIYVSTTGSDANDGLSITRPKRTIQAAYTLTQVGGGDIVNILPGEYTDFNVAGEALYLGRGGPTTIQALFPGTVTLRCNEPGRLFGIFVDPDAVYTTISGLRIIGAPYTAIFVQASGTIVQWCEITGNGYTFDAGHEGNQGIYQAPATTDCIFRGNYIHDNGGAYGVFDHGIYPNGDYSTIRDNIIARVPGNGIQLTANVGDTADGWIINNNLIRDVGNACIMLYCDGTGTISFMSGRGNMLLNARYGIGTVSANGTNNRLQASVIDGMSEANISLTDFGSTIAVTTSPSWFSYPDNFPNVAAGSRYNPSWQQEPIGPLRNPWLYPPMPLL